MTYLLYSHILIEFGWLAHRPVCELKLGGHPAHARKRFCPGIPPQSALLLPALLGLKLLDPLELSTASRLSNTNELAIEECL